MNFSQLQCFVALADTLSFTEAGYRVNMTQSAVSHALASLERELGVSLLERNNKGVVAVTGIGIKLITHARELLAQAETIQQEAKAAQGIIKGKLRVGSAHPIASPLLAGILANFQQHYPDIEVVLFEGSFQEVQEWINSSVVDVGFERHRIKAEESTLLVTDEMQVFAPVGHHLETRSFVTMKDLQHEHLIMRPTGCDISEIYEHIHGGQGPRVSYQAIESSTILAMVREGLGITILPRMMLPDKLDGIVNIGFDPPRLLPIGLAVKSVATASPVANLFIQTAVRWIDEKMVSKAA